MAEVLEYAARLSQEIGARPSGTEEEQQASFFIEETLQKSGLDTEIEEFNCNPNFELPRVIFCAVAIVLAALTLFFKVLVIPAFIVTLVLAALFVLEVIGGSPFAKKAKRGISQNVVARYIPGAHQDAAAGSDGLLLDGESASVISGLDDGPAGGRARNGRPGRGSARKRKIVIVARYDSGKVRYELKPAFMKVLEVLPWVEIGGFALIPIALLVRMIFDSQGPLLVILNTVVVIGIIVMLVPIILYILHHTAPWSDGANNNASGAAVMLEVAQRIAKSAQTAGASAETQTGTPRISVEGRIVMHGADAVADSGLLPPEAELVYEDGASGAGASAEEGTAETIALGDAAVPADGDALTVPVGGDAFGVAQADAPAAREGGRSGTAARATGGPAQAARPAPAPVPSAPVFSGAGSAATGGQSSVPDWFKRGIEAANANKEAQDLDRSTPVHRSKFSDALDAARETSAGSIEEFASRESAREADAGVQAGGGSGFVSPWSPASAGAAAGAGAAAPSTGAGRRAGASASPAGAGAQAAVAERAQAKEPADPQATGELSVAAAAAVEAAQAQEAAQLAQSVEEVAEQAAAADRTISFIPVAADISAAEVVESVDATQPDVLAKTPGEILAEATSATGVAGNPRAASASKDAKRQKRTIALPSLTGAIEAVSASVQAAPLADDAERALGEERSVVKRESLAASVPTLDAAPAAAEPEPVAFASSSFEPVSDELIANMEQDDIVIEDVDDSDYETNTTPTGAIAGPGYVDMPKSRASRLRGIFGRKKKEAETSFTEAVGLDADFDARKVGADRGGWESFQNESADWDNNHAGQSQHAAQSESAEDASPSAKTAKPATPARAVSSAKAAPAKKARAARSSGASQSGRAASRPARSSRGAHSRSIDEMRAEEEPRPRKTASDWDQWDDDDDWNGGGFSLSRIGDAVKGAAKGGASADPDGAAPVRSSNGTRKARSSRATDGKQRRKNPGEMLAAMAQDAADEVNASEAAYAVTSGSTGRSGRRGAVIDAEDMIDERERIRNFRTSSAPLTSFEDVAAFAGSISASMAQEAGLSPDETESDMRDLAEPQGFQTEVWFVALGAEGADNAGMKAFLAEHAPDLRGAVIIDIEAMGAGTLSLIESEGTVRRKKASSRMKRYVTKAGSALGMRVEGEKMNWCESAAYCAAKSGHQTIHVVGMSNGKPAYLGEADDRIDNIDEDKLLENAAFVLELLHNI